MKLYTWWDAGEDEQAFFSASLASARKALKEHLREETMFSIPIERIDVGSLSRELLLRVLNGEGYVNEKTTVETWQAFACERCEECKDGEQMSCSKKQIRKI